MSSEYLRQHPILLVLSIAPAVLASLVLAVSFHPWVYRRILRWRLPIMITAYVMTRPVLMYVIYGALGNRSIGNDNAWWTWMGRGVLAGKIPYRDFLCSHSPLFPYLMGIAYGIWNQAGAAVIIFIVFDILSLLLLCKFAKLKLGEDKVMDIAWLYVLNPVIWIVTVRYSQDETIISTFLLLTALLYTRGSSYLNPVIIGLGMMFTKFTTAIGMAVIYSFSKTKVRDALVAAVVIIIILLPFYLQQADITAPLAMQDKAITGVSITSLIHVPLTNMKYLIPVQRMGTILSLLGLAVVLYVAHRRKLPILDTLIVCLMVFLLFAPRSFKFYRVWYIGALGIHAVRTGKIGRYAFYTALLSLFDDFCFVPIITYPIMYFMAVIGLGIVCLEAKYVLEILFQKKSEQEDTTSSKDAVEVSIA